MRVDLFDFDLPDELIALHPAVPRDAARLLVVRPPASFDDARFADLPDLLRPGDLLVFNDTKVIPAALEGRRIGRGEGEPKVSVNLHKRESEESWRAFARPARKLAPGDRLRFGTKANVCALGYLEATVTERGEGGEVTLVFDLSGPVLDEAIAAVGAMPLPPYIASRREAGSADVGDYQTVYARREGAVAAPTAGLHFTAPLLARLADKGIGACHLTLHVGAGTFLPVKVADTAGHQMHAEWGEVTDKAAERINRARAEGGRIVAVGTTALRLLESAADEAGRLHPFCGETDIFITPGYRFRTADLLITNFHLPRSTLFMLVAAFSGLETMRAAYAHAIDAHYRFYSYGDASLLERAAPKDASS